MTSASFSPNRANSLLPPNTLKPHCSQSERSDLLANLALTDFVQGRFNEACAGYRAAIRNKPDSAALNEGLANVLKSLGKNGEAIAHLNIALRYSSKTETRLDLAGLLFMTGDFGRAVDQYRKVLSLQPDNVAALNNLAYVLMTCPDRSIHDGGEAIKLSDRACRLTSFKAASFLKLFLRLLRPKAGLRRRGRRMK